MRTHICDIQIRFGDTDLLGHVNNAFYLSYFELARIQFFSEAFNDSIDWKDEGVLLANANINYIKPILLSDKVKIKTWICKIGNKSFTFKHEIFSDVSDIIFSKAELTLVCVSYKRNESIYIPENWKKTLEEYHP